MDKVTETPITNGAYNSALNDAILELHKLIGAKIAAGSTFRDVELDAIRAAIKCIDGLRLGQ